MSAPDPDSPQPAATGGSEPVDLLPPRWQTAVRWGAPVVTLAALAWLCWNCVTNPKIHFLPPDPGTWIVYPLPPETRIYDRIALVGTFRRSFDLSAKPATAFVSWRCCTMGQISVNGAPVAAAVSAPDNWKQFSQIDLAPFLRQGSNEISVEVTNRLGPPALSLELRSANFALESDASWETSIFGATWRPAQLASATPRPQRGNDIYGMETTLDALGRCWPWLLLFAAISIGGVIFFQSRPTTQSPRTNIPAPILMALAAVWLLLFLHNLRWMPAGTGFDASSHMQYIRYIQEHKSLPSAREGPEMFQPPLYYALGAGLMELGQTGPFQERGLMLLRVFSMLIDALTLLLVFEGLRLIFPDDWKKQLVGLIVAAFLPAQIYLGHYPTNETLAAMFTTGALCLALHLLRSAQPWRGWYAALGIMLGLAFLSKSSAVLPIAAVFGALAVKLIISHERAPLAWADTVGLPLLICLLIGGWHYLTLWQTYGNPFIGSWDPKILGPWWQSKGFETPAYFLSFGESLFRPFFSGFHSFWDNFYSTLWGDGLTGGRTSPASRPPWNYDLMTAGFIFALVPTTLVLTGIARIAAATFRAARISWLMLAGLAWMFFFALFDLTLSVPAYQQGKAFFLLPLLLPFCAAAALGFEFWAARGKAVRNFLCVALAVWAANSYASFWIRPNMPETALSIAIGDYFYVKPDSPEPFLDALKIRPADPAITLWLAKAESKTDPASAAKVLEPAIKLDPDNDAMEAELAWDLAASRQTNEALVHAKRAIELAPQNSIAAQIWCQLEVFRESYAEAVTASRYALSLNPTEPATHFNLGLALLNLHRFTEASSHLAAALTVRPGWAEAHYCLGLCYLNTPGKRAEGAAQVAEAVRLNPGNPAWRATLEAAEKQP